jgi:hypothetical protein
MARETVVLGLYLQNALGQVEGRIHYSLRS